MIRTRKEQDNPTWLGGYCRCKKGAPRKEAGETKTTFYFAVLRAGPAEEHGLLPAEKLQPLWFEPAF